MPPSAPSSYCSWLASSNVLEIDVARAHSFESRAPRTGEPLRRLGSRLTGAAHLIFERGQLLDADRSAGMQAPGGDADFRTTPELLPVRDLRGDVWQSE